MLALPLLGSFREFIEKLQQNFATDRMWALYFWNRFALRHFVMTLAWGTGCVHSMTDDISDLFRAEPVDVELVNWPYTEMRLILCKSS